MASAPNEEGERIPTGDATAAAGPAREYSIDELAAVTQVPSRTIRFYQSKKALPPPERRGRKAVYGDEHVARLQWIAHLQEQGLTIKAIQGLLASADRGELDLTDWLGLRTQMQTPWADDKPRLMTSAELTELIGEVSDHTMTNLVRLGLLAHEGADFQVPSPALLRITMRLKAGGIDLVTSAQAARMLRRHLSLAATQVARHVLAHLAEGSLPGPHGERLERAFDALRLEGLRAVQLLFAREIQTALREELKSDAVADVVRRRPKDS